MKKELFVLCLVLLPLYNYVFAGNPTTKEFNFDAITEVALESSFNVSIKYGAKQKVVITGSDEHIEKLNVRLKGKRLLLGMKKGRYNNLNLKAEITIPYLDMAIVAGSGDMEIGAFDNLSNLGLIVSGSGNIITTSTVAVQNTVDIKISGSGNIRVNGTASHSNILISGSGDSRASKLKTSSNNSLISGSGNAEIDVTNKLSATLSGSGNVYYTGAPAIDRQEIGSGRVKPNY